MKPDRALRQLVHDTILARKQAGGFVVNDFKLGMTHRPIVSLPDVPDAGQVWIIALAADDFKTDRADGFTREFPVQVALQKVLKQGSAADQDKLIDLYEDLEDELRDACRAAVADHGHLTWLRNEALKDENGTTFNYVGLREASTFEAFFTAFYKAGLR